MIISYATLVKAFLLYMVFAGAYYAGQLLVYLFW